MAALLVAVRRAADALARGGRPGSLAWLSARGAAASLLAGARLRLLRPSRRWPLLQSRRRGRAFCRRGGSPPSPRAALCASPLPPSRPGGRLMRYFNAGGRGFALGPRAPWARVVAGVARALPRRLLCGRLRLRLRGLRPLPASRAPPLRRSPGPVGGGAARLVLGRCADGSEGGKGPSEPSTIRGPAARRSLPAGLPR